MKPCRHCIRGGGHKFKASVQLCRAEFHGTVLSSEAIYFWPNAIQIYKEDGEIQEPFIEQHLSITSVYNETVKLICKALAPHLDYFQKPPIQLTWIIKGIFTALD